MKTVTSTIKTFIVIQLFFAIGLWAVALTEPEFRHFAHMVLMKLYVG